MTQPATILEAEPTGPVIFHQTAPAAAEAEDLRPFIVSLHVPLVQNMQSIGKVGGEFGLVTLILSAESKECAIESAVEGVQQMVGQDRFDYSVKHVEEVRLPQAERFIHILSRAR